MIDYFYFVLVCGFLLSISWRAHSVEALTHVIFSIFEMNSVHAQMTLAKAESCELLCIHD